MTIDNNVLDQVTHQFLSALKDEGANIQHAAEKLFYYLVIIQLSLSALWMSLNGESLQRFFSRFVQMAFSFSFFYALIRMGHEWIPQLLNGFIQLGQQKGVESLDPSSIINQGMSIAGAIFKAFFGWGLLSHPYVSIVGAIICLSIVIVYALIAAELAIILVKSYIMVAMGGFFFALSATDYTREMTKQYFKVTIGIGLNLMSLYMLLGVGQHIGSQWAAMTKTAADNKALLPMLVIFAAVIVYYLILKTIPPFVARLADLGHFEYHSNASHPSSLLNHANVASKIIRTRASIKSNVRHTSPKGDTS